MDDRRARWVQVFGRLEARLHGALGAGAAAGPLHADPGLRDDASGREGMVGLLARAVHEGAAARDGRGRGLLAAEERLLDRADRADVHGGPRAADRLRQRGQPAHRQGHRAAEGDRRPAVARLLAWPPRAAAARREPACCPWPAACSGSALAFAVTRGLLALVPSQGQPLLISAQPDRRILAFTLALSCRHRDRLRAAAGAARQPPRPLDHAEGHRPDPSRARAVRCSFERDWSPRRWRSVSCCSSAPVSSCVACRTSRRPTRGWRSTTS